MFLVIGDKKLEITEEQLEPITSRRSGKVLGKIRFEYVICGEEANNSFLNLLGEAKKLGVEGVDSAGNSNQYEITNNSYIYSGHAISEDTIFNHIIELQEEDVKIEALVISGYEFSPYAYEENYNGDALIIRAKAYLTENQFVKLKEVMNGARYFSVIRQGISNDAITMRFDTTRWSKHENVIKHELNLIDIAYDRKHPDTSNSPQKSDNTKVQNALAYLESFQNELGELLVRKNVLSPEEIRDVKRQANDKMIDSLREFFRVDDIDT